jgi:hypothetical protein
LTALTEANSFFDGLRDFFVVLVHCFFNINLSVICPEGNLLGRENVGGNFLPLACMSLGTLLFFLAKAWSHF